MNSTDTVKPMNTTSDTNEIIDYALSRGFGDIHIKVDSATGMIAIIAIHSTKRGPALGGCRFIEYHSTKSAINDALRLALGMSSKAALANLPLGGGKAVIIKPRGEYDRTGYLNCFGKFINELGGRYITALDSGTTLADMDIIAQHTPYVASLSSHNGDPSPSTAKGTFKGIEASVLFKLGKKNLENIHVAVQGLGNVGVSLVRHLHEAGAKITVADINHASVELAVKEFGVNTAKPEDIHQVDCDVFAPCALGGVLNELSISQLRASIVAGSANNQLEHAYHGQQLHDKGILYAPDYVINAGGLILAASKYLKTSEELVNKQINGIAATLTEIFTRSKNENIPTNIITDKYARELLA